MVKVCFLYIIISILTTSTVAQQSVIKDSLTKKTKERYFNISIDVLSVSLQYEKRINNKWYAGIEILGGMGYRLIIGKSIKVLDYQSGDLSAGHFSTIFETHKFKFFFSNYINANIYQSFGPYGSIVAYGDGKMSFTTGLEYCFFMGLKDLKLDTACK